MTPNRKQLQHRPDEGPIYAFQVELDDWIHWYNFALAFYSAALDFRDPANDHRLETLLQRYHRQARPVPWRKVYEMRIACMDTLQDIWFNND
jgi:hypothetical protein